MKNNKLIILLLWVTLNFVIFGSIFGLILFVNNKVIYDYVKIIISGIVAIFLNRTFVTIFFIDNSGSKKNSLCN
jgi:uncharacterized membrane protein (DUF4010 family)